MKRLFTIISLMAILNLTALAGLVGYACTRGWVEPERVRRALAVLKGEEQVTDAASAVEVAESSEPTGRTSERLRRDEELDEKRRIELSRRMAEVKNGFSLLELEHLKLVQANESFEEERRRFDAEREQAARKQGDSGVQAELDTLSGIDAKSAKELLKLKDDADVVRIMLAMDGRTRNKIVKQCKTTEERSWIGRVMEKFHDGKAARSEDLDAAP